VVVVVVVVVVVDPLTEHQFLIKIIVINLIRKYAVDRCKHDGPQNAENFLLKKKKILVFIT
jgi:hypothetical protein